MDEGDVGGADLRLHQQGVLDGHDLHEIFARLDHAADGADLDFLDGAAHGERTSVRVTLSLLDLSCCTTLDCSRRCLLSSVAASERNVSSCSRTRFSASCWADFACGNCNA